LEHKTRWHDGKADGKIKGNEPARRSITPLASVFEFS
jgi:hypothetical protein